jgi:hypothetical protein
LKGQKISKFFDVDLALKSGFFISGTSGAGKTNLAFTLVDELMKAGVVCFVFDPTLAWINGSSVPCYIVPKFETKEVFHSRKIQRFQVFNCKMNPKLSTIFDLSLLYVHQQKMLVEQIIGGLFRKQIENRENASPMMFIIEEAHLAFPNGVLRGGRKSQYEESIRALTIGRNFGPSRFGLLTQFPAGMDKLPIKLAEFRAYGATSETNDVHYIASIIGWKWARKLEKLKVGEFILDKAGKIQKIKVPLFESPRKAQPYNSFLF